MGLSIAACALLIGGVVLPRVVSERDRGAYERSADRYSSRQRVIDTERAWRQGSHQTGGGPIHPRRKGQVVVHVHTPNGPVAQLAHERARYAASTSRRAAAAKRRTFTLLILLAALVAVAVAAATGACSPWWCTLPGGLGLVTLGLGARAVKVGRENDAVMTERIAKLKAEVARRPRRSDVAPKADESAAAAEPAVQPAEPMEASSSEPARIHSLRLAPMDAVDSAPRARVVSVSDGDDEVESVHVAVASTEAREAPSDPFARPWTPMPVPKPTYAMKPLIQRRDVDTKALIAQQRIEVEHSRVPFRPTRPTTPAGVPMTSAEVAAGARVQFNVDDILESRRASGD